MTSHAHNPFEVAPGSAPCVTYVHKAENLKKQLNELAG